MTDIEKAKKAAETAKKLDAAKRELKQREGFLVNATKEGRDTSRYAIDVKYAAERLKSLQKELDKLT